MKSHKIIALYSFLFLITNLCLGQILYVDDNASSPSGTGHSWSDAFMYLQDALPNASAGDEIRVAQGTYRPDMGGGKTPFDRYATFNLKNAVSIIGGYAGIGEADPNLRDCTTYQSILSGDLLNNDVGTINDISRNDNSYNVVSSYLNDETATLDGFIVESGIASLNTVKQQRGGGLYNKDSSPSILNCTFQKNRARVHGGAFFNINGNPYVLNCTFFDNLAKEDGGGIYSESGSPRFEKCRFENNSANEWNSEGGGFYILSGNPDFLNCLFIGNMTGGYGSCNGAGGYIKAGNLTIINSKFLVTVHRKFHKSSKC